MSAPPALAVERALGPGHAETVNLCPGLSALREQLSEYDPVERYARRAVDGAANVPEPLRIRALAQLGTIERIRGRYAHADRLYREALDLAGVGRSAADLVGVLCGLGIEDGG